MPGLPPWSFADHGLISTTFSATASFSERSAVRLVANSLPGTIAAAPMTKRHSTFQPLHISPSRRYAPTLVSTTLSDFRHLFLARDQHESSRNPATVAITDRIPNACACRHQQVAGTFNAQ
jgi:hypothetical protein